MITEEQAHRNALLTAMGRSYGIGRHVEQRRNGERRIKLKPGDRVRFDGKATSWLVRASARDGRFDIATASLFGQLYYTIIDHAEGVRGALNAVFGVPEEIVMRQGSDAGIDALAKMLDGTYGLDEGEEPVETWEVSHRNRVPLNITKVVRA